MIKEEMLWIQDTVFKTLDFRYEGEIIPVEEKGVYVKADKNTAFIGCENKTVFARGLTLLAKNIQEGRSSFEISQTPRFGMCGAMLDMSRNGVMRVSSVKKYLETMACYGMNMLMLYTEDTYEVEDYPFFGYMRGRYTKEELKEIDDYADRLGIEVIPCIQTLGHLAQYLKWQEASAVRDTRTVLLCDEEKTYQFIEALIKTVRSAFRSGRIHIGMDEAHDVGLGAYLKKNGYKNRYDIINSHLKKVIEICKKYDFKPMIWSDMYFRLGSVRGDYYDLNSALPEDKIKEIPDVDLVYWDYYHTDKAMYEGMIKLHQRLGKPVLFAGGYWTWRGFLPNYKFSYEAMAPAMETCCKYGIKDVFATLWGDDGAETNFFLALPGLAIFSEYCYLGESCTEDDILAMSEFVTKAKPEETKALADFNHIPQSVENMGKKLIYSDILYNRTNIINTLRYKSAYENAYEVLKNANNPKWAEFHDYAKLLFEIIIVKCDVLHNLKKAYRENDRAYLDEVADSIIPDLIKKYDNLLKIHQKQWLETFKAFGWEVINARYGAVIARLHYAKDVLSQYLKGEISAVEELAEPTLQEPELWSGVARDMISTSVIF